MSRLRPTHCRPRAFELFVSHVDRLGTEGALWNAAVAIALHELEHVDPSEPEARLKAFVDRIRSRLHSSSPRSIMAHTHEVLFDEEGFQGDPQGYLEPANSYLPAVLKRRRGLPIILTLLYRSVLEPLGVPVEGVNAPGHFLARVRIAGDEHLIDPFHCGRVLTRDEAFERMEQSSGMAVPHSEAMLAPATDQEWLDRILRNLGHSFFYQGRTDDLQAMQELQGVLRSAR